MKTSCILPPVVWLPKQLSVSSWAVPGATAAGWSAELHQQILDIQSGQPTMAELTLPSDLLHRVDTSRRWEQVLEQTKKSLPELEPLPRGYLYLRRTTASGVLREGLIALLDLEQYSFEPGNTKPVRQPVPLAVQQVIARAKMREESPLEGSPIRLICKYNQEELFSSLRWYSEQAPCLYQGELILSGGHLQAWLVEDSQLEQQITHLFASKDGELVMVPVEGQEALAGAAAHWQCCKEEGADLDSPYRYCLVEVGSAFAPEVVKPMHRLVMGIQGLVLEQQLRTWCREQGIEVHSHPVEQAVPLGLMYASWEKWLYLKDKAGLPGVCLLEAFLADYLALHPMCSRDAVQEKEELEELTQYGHTGVLLTLSGEQLLKGVQAAGVMPAASFAPASIAESRFELECRSLMGLER